MTEPRPQAALQGCTRALAQSSACPVDTGLIEDWTVARYQADRIAFIHRYHDDALHRQLRPEDLQLASAFKELESLRCILAGSMQYPGVAENIRYLWSKQTAGRPVEQIIKILTQFFITPDSEQHPAWIQASDLTALKNSLLDQRQFAEVLLPRLDQWLQHFTSLQKLETDHETGLVESAMPALASDNTLADDADDADEAGTHQEEEPLSETEAGTHLPIFHSTNQDYSVFTRQQDRILHPARLVSKEQYQQLKTELARLLPDQHRVVKHLARKLQRHIMSRQQRHWQFNLDEGLLDTARLTRIVLHPGNPLAYKQEQDGEFPSTAVTLLVDNSGSMRGLPILHAALCIDVLVKTLEQCNISTEVLGYTTTGWKEQALESWTVAGNPDIPGRLNGLQHLVFKATNERWRKTQHSLGWLLQEEDMRENIDGEALQWAASRLLTRPETRKILIVLADGAPHDEATQSANGRGLLEKHLQQVSDQLEYHSNIDLLGIGLGHDLSRYYSRSAVIHRAEQMAEVLITELDALLASTDQKL